LQLTPFGRTKLDQVRIAQAEADDPVGLHLGAVTDADDIQFPDKTGGHARHCIRSECSRQSVHRSVAVIVALDFERAVILFEADAGHHRNGQLSLRAFHQNLFADGDLDALRQWDRLFSYSRHLS
jgi:hypothetical protein